MSDIQINKNTTPQFWLQLGTIVVGGLATFFYLQNKVERHDERIELVESKLSEQDKSGRAISERLARIETKLDTLVESRFGEAAPARIRGKRSNEGEMQ